MTHPNDPRILLHNAVLLERAGRMAEAEAAYVAALSRWPHLPDAWYNLALLQRRTGRFEAALSSYQQALDRGVSRPEEVHLNRGVIYSDCLRQDAAAEAELAKALELNPHYAPALQNLANLKEDLGDRAAAIELYERLLAIEPEHHEALARYASLAAATDRADPLTTRVRNALARPDLSAADRASLGFALGKRLDACGAYAEAFDAYVAANRASRESAGGAARYDRREHERFVDRLIAAFKSPPHVSAGSQRKPPIFICGMFRSGSTLLEQVLGAHSQVTPGGELGFVPALANSELAPFPERLASLSQLEVERLAARYLDAVHSLFPNAAVVTDKRPDNFLYIGLIKTLFPDARIIHTRRHPLDNCLSIFFLHLDHSMAYALDLEDIAHYYREYRRLMSHWRSCYGDDILDVDYDALVSDPRPEIARTLAFLGLEWEDACLNFHTARTAVKTASVWQVREPLYRRASGRWRNYAPQLASVQERLREFLAE